MTDDVRRASSDLLDVADRLIGDYDQISAGTILRCLSRAVRMVRDAGCPLDKLPAQAETTARTMLDYRLNAHGRAVTKTTAAPAVPVSATLPRRRSHDH